jgi:hypothetical protein
LSLIDSVTGLQPAAAPAYKARACLRAVESLRAQASAARWKIYTPPPQAAFTTRLS